MLSYNDIEEIKQAGFIGFKTVAEMKSGGCRELPLVGRCLYDYPPHQKEAAVPPNREWWALQRKESQCVD